MDVQIDERMDGRTTMLKLYKNRFMKHTWFVHTSGILGIKEWSASWTKYLRGILFATKLVRNCQVQCAATTVWGRGIKCWAEPNPDVFEGTSGSTEACKKVITLWGLYWSYYQHWDDYACARNWPVLFHYLINKILKLKQLSVLEFLEQYYQYYSGKSSKSKFLFGNNLVHFCQ